MRADLATDDLSLDLPEDFVPLPVRRPQRVASAPPRRASEPDERDEPSEAPTTTLTLSTLLRGLGALVVTGAFVLYLFQGWRGGDDLTRALLLLGHTLALTLAGFGLGHWLQEPRGARLFIALALAAMPVSFAFLGGLLYTHIGTVPPDAAAAGFWQPAAGGALALAPALLLTLGASAVLALAIGIGFLVLARRSAWPLTGLYLAANLALLVPVRDGLGVAALLLGLGLLLGAGAARLRSRDAALATAEGRFAQLVLALPLAVIAGRSLWLYAPDALLFAVLALLGYAALRAALDAGVRWPAALEAGATLFALLTASAMLAVLIPLAGVPDPAKLPATALVLAALLLDLGNRPAFAAPRHRRTAAGLVAGVMAFNLVAFGGLGPALGAVAAGGVALAAGYGLRSRMLFAFGLAVTLLGIGYAVQGLIAGFSLGTWTTLVLLGSASIVAGSLVERHGTALRGLLARGRRRFDAAT
ncbi:hypothetical protein [Thiohalocapsa sp. ML1]|uniref:hypothetical protein n=1 Tax=Thiohalocapsa sp. ML1 TaxID=1431688 RepID=UPI000731FD0B|nr:hypothetical protein [Thiohalocapsa sp. ML1]